MSAQIRQLAVCMALSFCCALAFFWWQQRPATATRPSTALPRSPAEPSRLPAPTFARVQASEVPHVTPSTRIPAVPEAPQPNYDGPPLPVLFAVTGETVRGRGPNADGEPVDPSQVVNIANIANSSDQPLALTIIAVNASTQKTAQVSLFLTPGGRQALGPDAGLRLDSGDQITLRSQGFHDFVATVP